MAFKFITLLRWSLSTRDVHGDGVLITADFFLEDTAKMREFAQNFSVYKCDNVRLDESHRLVTTVLFLSSQSPEIQNIFLETIATLASFSAQCTSLLSENDLFFDIFQRIKLDLKEHLITK